MESPDLFDSFVYCIRARVHFRQKWFPWSSRWAPCSQIVSEHMLAEPCFSPTCWEKVSSLLLQTAQQPALETVMHILTYFRASILTEWFITEAMLADSINNKSLSCINQVKHFLSDLYANWKKKKRETRTLSKK